MEDIYNKFLERAKLREKLKNSIQFGATNALRLLNGKEDGIEFADITIDQFGDYWLISAPFPMLAETNEKMKIPTKLRWLQKLKENHRRPIFWKQLDISEKQPPILWSNPEGEKIVFPIGVSENGLNFLIDFTSGYSQGLFLDQRDNRTELRIRCQMKNAQNKENNPPKPITVLNCFSYTCAFSVAAAASRAITTNVDLSKNYLEWGKRNFAANGIDPSIHSFLAGDVFDWLNRFRKKEQKFDFVILDPPTFSRNRKGKVFRAGHDYGELASAAALVLNKSGTLFCSCNQHDLPPGALKKQVLEELRKFCPNPSSPKVKSLPMPADFPKSDYLQAIWIDI